MKWAAFDAEKLRSLRREQNLTMEQLGARIGASRQLISLWETGRHIPQPRKLRLLADALRVAPHAAATLKDLRVFAGLDVAEVAGEVGIHPDYLQKLEAGVRTPQPELTERLARLYRVTGPEFALAYERTTQQRATQQRSSRAANPAAPTETAGFVNRRLRTNPRVAQRTWALDPHLEPDDQHRLATQEWMIDYTARLANRAGVAVTLLDRDGYQVATGRRLEVWHRGDADWSNPTRRVIYVEAGLSRHEAAQVIGHELGHHLWPGDQHRARFFTKVQRHLLDPQTP